MNDKLLTKQAILEILTQANYAETAFGNIELKGPTSNLKVFSSIHSFLTHCGMISKLLWSEHLTTCQYQHKFLAEILQIPETACLKNRKFRNVLEHYDEYLKKWVKDKGPSINILDNNIGPRNMIQINNAIWVRHYEPSTKIFTLINNDLNLNQLMFEVGLVKEKATAWLNPVISWEDMADDEKQEFNEDLLLDELSSEYDLDPEGTMERLEELGYSLEDITT